jgi:hypothetical protein
MIKQENMSGETGKQGSMSGELGLMIVKQGTMSREFCLMILRHISSSTIVQI